MICATISITKNRKIVIQKLKNFNEIFGANSTPIIDKVIIYIKCKLTCKTSSKHHVTPGSVPCQWHRQVCKSMNQDWAHPPTVVCQTAQQAPQLLRCVVPA